MKFPLEQTKEEIEAEIADVKNIISRIPEDNVIDRLSMEYRLSWLKTNLNYMNTNTYLKIIIDGEGLIDFNEYQEKNGPFLGPPLGSDSKWINAYIETAMEDYFQDKSSMYSPDFTNPDGYIGPVDVEVEWVKEDGTLIERFNRLITTEVEYTPFFHVKSEDSK